MLIETKVPGHTMDYDYFKLLTYATHHKCSYEFADFLLEKYILPYQSISNQEYGRLLNIAVHNEAPQKTVELFLAKGADPDYDDQDRVDFPLCTAISKRQLDSVRLLLKKGANPELESKFYKKTYGYPLFIAARTPYAYLFITELCKHGAKADIVNECGNTFLHHLAISLCHNHDSKSTFAYNGKWIPQKNEDVITNCRKIMEIEKATSLADQTLILNVCMAHKRKDCILSKIPKKLFLYMIGKFLNISNPQYQILLINKEFLAMRNNEKKTATQIFLEYAQRYSNSEEDSVSAVYKLFLQAAEILDPHNK